MSLVLRTNQTDPLSLKEGDDNLLYLKSLIDQLETKIINIHNRKHNINSVDDHEGILNISKIPNIISIDINNPNPSDLFLTTEKSIIDLINIILTYKPTSHNETHYSGQLDPINHDDLEGYHDDNHLPKINQIRNISLADHLHVPTEAAIRIELDTIIQELNNIKTFIGYT